MALVDCQLEGIPWKFHHVCQGKYVIFNHTDFDIWRRKRFSDCVDRIGGGGGGGNISLIGW